MKFLFFIFMISTISLFAQNKSASGQYKIEGNVFIDRKIVSLDSMVIDSQNIYIGDSGKFSFMIEWYAHESFFKRSKNKKWIIIEFKNNKFLMKNKWKKYGLSKFKKLEIECNTLNFNFNSNKNGTIRKLKVR